MDRSRKYNNPPIVEVLCEFYFIPSQSWNTTIPELLYEKMQAEFSVREQADIVHGIRFFNSNKSAVIQIAPDLLTINHLKPCPTWQSFKPLVLNNLEKYQEIAKPKGFNRIGLRFINQIKLNEGTLKLSDYFEFYPFIPACLSQTPEMLQARIQIPQEEGRDRLLLTLESMIPENPGEVNLFFDLDYITAMPGKVSLSQVSEWLDKAHSVIETSFEVCITDQCRSLFGEEK